MALIPRMDVYTQLILLSGTYPSAARKVYLSSGPEEVSQSMWIEAKDADVVPAGRDALLVVFTASHDGKPLKRVGRPKE
jgi:hypothetical protein